jgi:hypothetical protein
MSAVRELKPFITALETKVKELEDRLQKFESPQDTSHSSQPTALVSPEKRELEQTYLCLVTKETFSDMLAEWSPDDPLDAQYDEFYEFMRADAKGTVNGQRYYNQYDDAINGLFTLWKRQRKTKPARSA